MASDYGKSIIQGGGAVISAGAAANGVPTTAQMAHASVGMHARIDVVLSETAGGTYDAKLWWFYADAGVWVEDLAVGTLSVAANGTAGAVTTPSAASSLYVETLNFAGGAHADAWLIGRGTLGRWA